LQEELIDCAIEHALKLGASYVDVRLQDLTSENITVENGSLREYRANRLVGAGVRVIVNKAFGFASSTTLNRDSLRERVGYAVKMAKASAPRAEPPLLAAIEPKTASAKVYCRVDPEEVPPEVKIRLTREANKAAMAVGGVKNSTTSLSWFRDTRCFGSSEGASVRVETTMVGYGQFTVAFEGGRLEQASDSSSRCSGFEFVREDEFRALSEEVSRLAVEAVKARTPKRGRYEVVADPRMVGLILHEAFGHASEGDLVETSESVLSGMLGRSVASPLVTIVDEGVVEGGFFVPYDDEGTPKTRQVIVEEGVLTGYLHSRKSAEKLNGLPTGNGRAQDFASLPIVRQTNLFMEGGGRSFEELVEDVDNGLYVLGRGAGGGEVDVGQGTFTFTAGPSYVIENGELGELVRGVSISGMILETLRGVTGVGDDPAVRTGVFGGCGKNGQRVHVGFGGPHIRVQEVLVGGLS